MPQKLTTIKAVIEALGGTEPVMALIGARNASAVSNWRTWNHMPSRTYVVMQDALRKQGLRASPKLWGMVE